MDIVCKKLPAQVDRLLTTKLCLRANDRSYEKSGLPITFLHLNSDRFRWSLSFLFHVVSQPMPLWRAGGGQICLILTGDPTL